jgi:hypothetical protein
VTVPKPILHVTHHALIRYLERVRGFKFDNELAQIRRICGETRNGTVKAHGCLFEIKDGKLVTIVPEGKDPSQTKRRDTFTALSGK